MASTLYLSPLTFIVQYLTNAGVIAAGASVQTNLAGSVATAQTTFQDSSGLVPNANPVVLNASGRAATQQGALTAFWVAGGVSIDAIFTDTLGETWAIRNIPGINDPAATGSIQSLLSSPASSNSAGVGPVAGADLVANAIKSYDVIADVRAANQPVLASGQTLSIQVQGGIAINDGLGGDFYWNATSALADNGTTVIKPNVTSGNGRWLRLATPPFGAQAAIVSAATCDLGTLGTNQVQVSGTTTITSFGATASTAHPLYFVEFAASLTLTFNGATLIIPGGQNIVTQAGDTAILQYLGAGAWQVLHFTRVFANPPGDLFLVRTNDQAIANSTVLTNDNQLSVATLLPGFYLISLRLMLLGTGGTAQGYKVALAAAGTIAGLALGAGVVSGNGTPAAVQLAVNGTIVQAAISATGDSVNVDFNLVTTTNGALNVQFAQNTSSANGTQMKAGSAMIVKRMA